MPQYQGHRLLKHPSSMIGSQHKHQMRRVLLEWLAGSAPLTIVFAAVLRGGVTGLRKSRLLISAGWSATELVWIALPCGCLYACQAQTMTWLHSRALVGPSVASRAGRDRRIVLVRFLTVVTLKT